MRIFKYSVPIAIIVGWIAWFMLGNNFQEVPKEHRLWIVLGAGLLSGILAYFLFPKSEERKK